MLFNSFDFIYFFLIVTTAYFALPHKYRWLLLLLSSCYFYMAFVPIYILILWGTIIIDYIAGIFIEQQVSKPHKGYAKFFLVVSLIANIGILAVFKYYNFFIDNTHLLFQSLGLGIVLPYLEILLPIGLSFHTFQAMSYTIEVYRSNQKAERHFGRYALYVMFYPQLVAGPIERPQQMLYQFYDKKEFNYDRVKSGLLLMLIGFFKKIVIADRLAVIVNPVFDQPQQYPTSSLALAAACFSFQIYCDFSGYSDIAIGSARVMGFDLMKNFNKPYFSRSVSEFWKRWHISLSSWFRDYVYVPLGGNRVNPARWIFNILVVFVLSGLWHGANWTFLIWGALNGMYLVAEHFMKPFVSHYVRSSGLSQHKKIIHTIRILATFFLVTIAWIFFRANSVGDALYIIRHLFMLDFSIKLPGGLIYILVSLGFVALLETMEWIHKRKNLEILLAKQSMPLRWAVYYTMLFVILYFGEFDDIQFIYFQF